GGVRSPGGARRGSSRSADATTRAASASTHPGSPWSRDRAELTRRACGGTGMGGIACAFCDDTGMPIDGFDDVLAAAQRGDERALETIYRDLSPLVLGYLRSNGARDPDDLTSEVFVAVVRNLGSFSGDERSFRSWVLTITHRRLVDS